MLEVIPKGKQRHEKDLCIPKGAQQEPCLCNGATNKLSWIVQYAYKISADVLSANSGIQKKGELFIKLLAKKHTRWLNALNKESGSETHELVEYWRVNGNGETDPDCHNYYAPFNAYWRCALDGSVAITLTLRRYKGAPDAPYVWESGTYEETYRKEDGSVAGTNSGNFKKPPGAPGVSANDPNITIINEPSRTYSDKRNLDPNHCKDWGNYIEAVDTGGDAVGRWLGPNPNPEPTLTDTLVLLNPYQPLSRQMLSVVDERMSLPSVGVSGAEVMSASEVARHWRRVAHGAPVARGVPLAAQPVVLRESEIPYYRPNGGGEV